MRNNTQGSKSLPAKSLELQQHFQNYFELLLGAERATLRHAITIDEVEQNADALTHQVEQRIAFLKGAVRMGRLLCLINADDAKLKHDILMSERDELLARCGVRRRQRSSF
jgi:hypothetical protein